MRLARKLPLRKLVEVGKAPEQHQTILQKALSPQQLFPALVQHETDSQSPRSWLSLCKSEKSFQEEITNSLALMKELFSLKIN